MRQCCGHHAQPDQESQRATQGHQFRHQANEGRPDQIPNIGHRSRFENLAPRYMGFLQFVSVLIWLR
jgi:hypothetical protein